MTSLARLSLTIAATLSLTTVAQAQMTFTKRGDPSIRLVISKNGIGTIEKAASAGKRAKVLVAGEVIQEVGSLTIMRPEGDVCPDVSVAPLIDVKERIARSVLVTNLFDGNATAGRQSCSVLNLIAGTYDKAR